MDIRVAYSYSLDFSDQLSCIKFFHLSYGLKDINFQSFIQKEFLDFLLLFNSNIIQNSALTEGAHLSYTGVFDWSN